MARSKSQAAQIKRDTQKIMRNARAVVRDQIPRDIERTLTTVGIVVANKAMEYTPLEFSMLQNSQYHIVESTATGWRVKVGYTQDYAAALHERTDWSPRPPDMKSGPAWNPNAKHHFLTRAAEEEKQTLRRIVMGDLEL